MNKVPGVFILLILILSNFFVQANPRLKTVVLVDSDVVRMGDVLHNAGKISHIKLAPAPAPGKHYSLRVGRILAIAKRYGLKWQPQGPRTIVVKRDSKIIPHRLIIDALRDAADHAGVSSESDIELKNQNLVLYIPKSASPTIAVDNFQRNIKTNRFTAVIRVPAQDDAAPRVTIRGQIYSIAEAPVLAKSLGAGEIITADDIIIKEFHLKDISNGFVTDRNDLIGFAAKRRLSAVRPIRSRDIQRPFLIHKGEPVTMAFTRANLRLIASGRALENGSRGEMIRIQNLRTKKTVEGIVDSSGRVNVNFRTDQLSALR